MTMKREITVTVNGQQHRSEVEPRLLLVHYLREVLDLTGTHVGCDTSQCGACTVLLNDEAVKSCTVLTVPPSPPSRAWPPRKQNSTPFRPVSGRSMVYSAAFARLA